MNWNPIPRTASMCGAEVRLEGAQLRQAAGRRKTVPRLPVGSMCASCGQRLIACRVGPVVSFQAVHLRRHQAEPRLFPAKHWQRLFALGNGHAHPVTSAGDWHLCEPVSGREPQAPRVLTFRPCPAALPGWPSSPLFQQAMKWKGLCQSV